MVPCLSRLSIAALASIALAVPAHAAGRVVITEIMYNPNSKEDKGQSEWIEIANVARERSRFIMVLSSRKKSNGWPGTAHCTVIVLRAGVQLPSLGSSRGSKSTERASSR